MRKPLLVGEDALCCALGARLVAQYLPDWSLSPQPINTRGVTKLEASIPRYVQYAQHSQPVICIADTDRRCPIEFMEQLGRRAWPSNFLMRLAVSEAEDWLLADKQGAADFFGLSVAKLSDRYADASREVLRLARMSRVRSIREEVVSSIDINKPGSGFNVHMCRFAMDAWSPERAAENSKSLRQAKRRISQLGQIEK